MSTPILDQTDHDIISLLQEDARLTNKQIAAKLRRRPSTILMRFNRLKDLGYLKENLLLNDKEKFKDLMIVIINIQLDDHSSDDLIAFQKAISAHNEVLECYHTTGQVDFVLKVVVQNMDAYKDFHIQKLSKMENVKAYTSHFVINETKKDKPQQLINPM
jgi:Lrp/AsnC family leucine-responsive transcriptional regulator